MVNANATLSAVANQAGASLCQLVDDSAMILAQGNEDGEVSNISLTAVVSNSASVDLECSIWTDGGGRATDISVTAIEVEPTP